MLYRIAADFVVVVHAAYVLFVLLGFLLTVVGMLAGWKWVRNPWFRGLHLLMIGVVVFETWAGITCPLTTWEQSLREQAGQAVYEGDCIANFIHDWLFCEAPTWVFTTGYTLFGLLIAATWIFAPPQWSRARRNRVVEQSGGTQPGAIPSHDEHPPLPPPV